MEGERVSPLSFYLYTPVAEKGVRTYSLSQVSALERARLVYNRRVPMQTLLQLACGNRHLNLVSHEHCLTGDLMTC